MISQGFERSPYPKSDVGPSGRGDVFMCTKCGVFPGKGVGPGFSLSGPLRGFGGTDVRAKASADLFSDKNREA